MNSFSALEILNKLDQNGRYIYLGRDLRKLFFNDRNHAFQAGLKRLVRNGILQKPARAIYVFAYSRHKGAETIEEIAINLRRGHYNYISLESALSIYGAISQIPLGRLTVMTTGRVGEFSTPFGTIEFTHTKRPISQIMNSTRDIGRPLRLADKVTAFRDLKRVGRNIHLVNQSEIYEQST